MGIRSYYKQFAGMTDEEITDELREQAAEARRQALSRIEALDLSQTTWHELPHPDVVAAVTFAVRGMLNLAPDPTAEELRRAIGRRVGIEPSRVAIGNGAGQLLSSATRSLVKPGEELLIPWPSYGLYPLMAQRAGAQAVPVPGGHDVERLLAAVTPRTRAIALCNPNDPTGAYIPPAALRELLDALPEHVSLLLDEALVDFVSDERAPAASLALLDDHPRLLIFRTFSKVYGLAGLRCGYVLGGPGSERLLAQLAPELGVGQPAQAGAIEAIHVCDPQVAARRATVIAERARVLERLHDLPLDAAPSEANVLWLRAPGLSASELTARLRRGGVIVMAGTEVGDEEHVRVAVQAPIHVDRLLEAARTAF
ncbi:pyridoxal phosphate-dependent aminotransferase [Conexibacter woesei]|uniref:Aminotransferase class I and II n=1 Tax=Conexibacter woesei (strain DSM 14684 / CCUG 47730 / CIP 108061 / JCM 11494 / NBRC 100937 / ID131577) TaxID=469383 RepID=D3EYU1_CONWI|nr:aminotransferase class I/II-fold pyridoxal phosphate-dependent enzyme [Conexibacter woesei]ADB49815.1 aminotransferase class I and II [Conexibacter woesei DSM 14684]